MPQGQGIVGQELDEIIKNQIRARQEIHGKLDRTPADINYLSNQTSWVKMASSVCISPSRIELLNNGIGDGGKIDPEKYQGRKLAEKFILFNGMGELDRKNNKILTGKSGVGSGYNNAYGFGGTETFGVDPMPFIKDFSIKNLNRGSLREANIKIKCFNRQQFDIIDVLYIRLGFFMLIEWGNSIYWKTSTKSSEGSGYEQLGETLSERVWWDPEGEEKREKPDYNSILSEINRYRTKYQGNYDGFMGKVTNFDWTFNDDGTYDISIKLISAGDVIESLKVNTTSTLTGSTKDLITELKNTGQSSISEGKPAIDIIRFLITLLKLFRISNPEGEDIDDNMDKGKFIQQPRNSEVSTFSFEIRGWRNYQGNFDYSNMEDRTLKLQRWYNRGELRKIYEWADQWSVFWVLAGENDDNDYTNVLDILYEAQVIRKSPQDEDINGRKVTEIQNELLLDDDSDVYFRIGNKQKTSPIKAGELLNYTNGIGGDSDSTKKDAFTLNGVSMNEPLYIRFGALMEFLNAQSPSFEPGGYKLYNILSEDSKIYSPPSPHSADPRICLINSYIPTTKDKVITFYENLPEFKTTVSSKGKKYFQGNLENVYLNSDFIESCLTEDENGDAFLFKFLKNICDGINKALGGVNNIEPIISDGQIMFIDQTPIPGIKENDSEFAIEIFGYNTKDKKKSLSNFVKKAGIKTTISKEYASMITIGSTAEGYSKGVEAGAFSQWNKGCVDVFKITLKDPNEGDPSDLPLPVQTWRDWAFEEFSLSRASLKAVYSTGATYKDSDFENDSIDANISKLTEFYKYLHSPSARAYDPPNQLTPSTLGFLPFNLELELEGISGIKIYNKITVNADFLPSNYPKVLDFIVTGVQHTIRDNHWVTKISTIATLRREFVVDLTTDYFSEVLVYGQYYPTFNVNADIKIDEEGNQVEDNPCLIAKKEEERKKILENLKTFQNSPQFIKDRYLPPSDNPSSNIPQSLSNFPPYDSSQYTINRKTPKLQKAVIDQCNYVFETWGDIPGWCAGTSYNIAYKIKEHIDTNSSTAISYQGGAKGYREINGKQYFVGGMVFAGGNADSAAHRRAIERLGIYNREYLGFMNIDEAIALVNKLEWNYGDILNYYAPKRSNKASGMHTQIYTNEFSKSRGGTGWTTSYANNYRGSWIYRKNKQGLPDDMWKVYAFKIKPEYLI